MKLKICGMKYASNIREAALLKPDFMGFIFYPGSKRFVGADFDPYILSLLPAEINKTGVFVNPSLEDTVRFIKAYGLDYVQLHGEESPGQCLALRKYVKVIKAFGVHAGFDFKITEGYEESCDYLLFDTYTKAHGGSGKSFDPDLLTNYTGRLPFFLSGGIGLEEIANLHLIHHPRLAGVDVNSRFETEPGLKNISELKKIKL